MEVPYRRIATEEAFTTADILRESEKIFRAESIDEPGFYSHMGYYLNSTSERAMSVLRRLQDIGDGRLKDMDDTGIDVQILSLAHPGVQVFEAPLARSLARSSNDELAQAVRDNPDRFAGLAAVAPQLQKRLQVNSTVRSINWVLRGRSSIPYGGASIFDYSKFWPIFEAAEALDVPIYLHPTNPPAAMIGPFLERVSMRPYTDSQSRQRCTCCVSSSPAFSTAFHDSGS